MSSENSKPMVTDVFVKGAIQGWNIATHSTIPNVLHDPERFDGFRDYCRFERGRPFADLGRHFPPVDGFVRSAR